MTDVPRPRGAFVVLVGPDGVGKSTVAERLMALRPDDAAYFHFLPPSRGPLGVPHPGEVRARADVVRGPRALGWLRLLRNAFRFWLGYLATVRPALRHGRLVIGDRWAYGYVAKPEPLKFGGPPWLARTVVRALPKPDLVVALTAPPEVIVARKPELTHAEAAREVHSWQQIPAPRLLVLDARRDPNALAHEVLETLRGSV